MHFLDQPRTAPLASLVNLEMLGTQEPTDPTLLHDDFSDLSTASSSESLPRRPLTRRRSSPQFPSAHATPITRRYVSHQPTSHEVRASIDSIDALTRDLTRSSDIASGLMESDTSNAAQMRVLLDNAKKIVTQLNSVMSYEYAVDFRAEDGQLPAYEQLVSKLNDAFRHQRDINQMHAKLLSVNYLVNLSNFAKNRQLSRALSRGKRQIMDLQNTVAVMEEAVDSLTEEVETQRKTAERLKGSLETTRALLETSMLEYRKEMNQQRDIINQQQRYVGAIQRNKYNQDFILDSSLFVFSLWAVNTVLVDYPIQVALSISMRPSRRRQWTRQGLKLVTMMVLLGRLKNGAAAYGLHNRVGSVFPYVQTLLEIARDALLRVFWSAKESSLP